MKKLFTRMIRMVPLLAMVLSFAQSNAQMTYGPLAETDFQISIQNIAQPSGTLNILEFDIYILDTDPSQDLPMATAQFGIYFNPGIFDGAATTTGMTIALPYSEGYSDLPSSMAPNGANTVATGLIRIAGRAAPGCLDGFVISKVAPGTRVNRFRITSPVPFLANSTPDFVFTSNTATNPSYATRFAWYNQACTGVQLPVVPGVNALVCCNPILNEFLVTGSGTCCEGSGGLPVGLSSSVDGEIYTLYKDGTAQVPTVTGTGSAIGFGNQLAGTYTVGPYSSGSAVIIENPLTIGGTVFGGDTIYEGNTTITLTLNGNTGSIIKWQKRLNEGTWSDIESTQQTYSEIPSEVGNWFYRALVKSGVCDDEFSIEDTVTVLNRTLLIKVYIQGLFNPSTGFLQKAQDEWGNKFQSDTADVITLRFAQDSYPFDIIYAFNNIGLPTNGEFTVNLPAGLTSSYYLVINHRNSIETWSSFPVSLYPNHTNFNFTNGAHKAYGYNLFQMGASWVIFGGDVNQDGTVDSADMSSVDNDNSTYTAGYLDSDVNGDGIVDTADIVIIDNNEREYVSSVTP